MSYGQELEYNICKGQTTEEKKKILEYDIWKGQTSEEEKR